MKKLFSGIVCLVFGLGLTSCTEAEWNLGIGAAAGIIIGAAVADSGHHDDGWQRGPGHYPRPHNRHHWGYDAQFSTDVELSQTQMLALKYNLTEESASVLLTDLEPAVKGDFTGLARLGITREDMKLMARGENPSVSALRGMSDRLGISYGEANDLIQAMKIEVRAAFNR